MDNVHTGLTPPPLFTVMVPYVMDTVIHFFKIGYNGPIIPIYGAILAIHGAILATTTTVLLRFIPDQPAIQTATAMPTMQTMPAMPPGPARGK